MISLEIDKIKKEFAKYFLLSFAVVFFFYIVVYYITDYYQINFFVVKKSFLYSGLLIILYTYYILSKAEYNFTAVFSVIFIVLFAFISYLALIISVISESILMFYIPLTFLFLLLYDYQKTIFFSFFMIILCYFMPNISEYFSFNFYYEFFNDNEQALKVQEYLGLLASTYFTFLILFYYKKILEIRMKATKITLKDNFNSSSKTQELVVDKTFPISENSKFSQIYEDIIHYFDVNKPYQNPNFSIRQLAEMLNSNTAYVSAALNKIGNKKFNQLVNEYRIKQVLDDLENGLHQQFTMEYIYKNAGFSQQSTFNRVFKEHTGSTPSEFIEKLK